MEERDYRKYDYIGVALNDSVEPYLTECYRLLGWEVTESDERPNKGMVYRTMRRSHFVPDRDTRQFLQIRVESEANKVGRLIRGRHKRSISTGIAFAVVALLLLGLGLGCILAVGGTVGIVCGTIDFVITAAAIVFGVVMVRRASKNEAETFRQKMEETLKELERLNDDVRSFMEGGNAGA